MVRNIKLTIAYDGTKYHGWQTQPGKVTVQGAVEEAVEIITKTKASLTASGRTDAGVHAMGQVANFKADFNILEEKIKIALNANLPDDIRVLESADVEDSFNSRFDAKKKTYMYQIYNARVMNPFYSRYACFVPSKLDIEKMSAAAAALAGTHDFRAFMAAGSESKTTVRTVYDTCLKQEREVIRFYVTGNGFLYNMVRIMVGTLIDIGKGTLNAACIEEALKSGDRTTLGFTAKPQGLFLKEVFYE